MSNEVVVFGTDDFDEISRLTGGNLNNSVVLPQLRINRDGQIEVDGEPVLIPMGAYCVSQDGKAVYSKTAKFRPFINAFQYQTYDSATEKYTNKSVIIKNFFEEAVDEQGGLKCGKVSKEQLANLSESAAAEQKKITCYRKMYGLLTMEGTSPPSKDKIEIVDLPVVWNMARSNFNAVKNSLDAVGKMKHHIFQHQYNLPATTKDKKGTTTFFLINVEPDLGTVLNFTSEDMATFKMFQDIIDRENKSIVNKWKASKKINSNNDSYISASKELELDDEVPFDM